MKIRIIAPVQRFKLENYHVGVEMNGVKLLRGFDVLDSINSNIVFFKAIGGLTERMIRNSYVLLFEGDSIFDQDKVSSVSQIASLYLDHYFAFFNGLWFIKDNSAALTTCYVQDLDTGEIGYSNKPVMMSNSQEGYEECEFSLSDIEQAAYFYDETCKYTEVEDKVIENFSNGPEIFTGSLLNHVGKIDNRICRALIFLDTVRTYPFLPQKIASYIAIFECLFTTSNGELTHQVSERVALFIGRNCIERMEIYSLVKSCYGVRSSFVHGDQIKQTRDTLLKLSFEIDCLTRKIMVKVIDKPQMFLEKETNGKKPIDEYFKTLLFK